jgi:hypothetical protein
MTDKEKYTLLMQRYWEAETTPEEERELARYAASVDDPDFEEIRGVLGYLSIGRKLEAAPTGTVSLFWRRAAGIAAAVVVGGLLLFERAWTDGHADALTSMESTLTDIFSSGTDIETELSEILDQ